MSAIGLGERIRQRREALGMTQQDLAIRCDYSTRSAISMIEKGRRDMPMGQLKIMAEALNCDPLWLMYGDDKEEVFNISNTAIEDAQLVAKYRALLPEDRAIIDSLLDSLYAKAQKRMP